MRNHAISLKDSTQQQRQELYDFLVAKEESIYTNTGLIRSNYEYSYFIYDITTNEWTGSSTTDLIDISISDFIAKFQEPKLNIRDYCIDCTDSTYDERQQIISYLSSISESIYIDTCFKEMNNDILKEVIFGYDEDSQEWMTRVDEISSTLTTKEFITKFINTGDTMSTINVGDVYLNSSGKTCTIIRVKSEIIYRHEDGKNYTISESSIIKNWTKQTTANYKIDKSKLKPRTIIICNTFEKALAITSIMGTPIEKKIYNLNSPEKAVIYVQSETDWEYSILEHYEEQRNWTLVEFEDMLIQPTVKFQVGDVVGFKPGIKPKDIFNDTTIVMVENMDTATFIITEIGEYDNVLLSNGYWYGIDALELVPKILKERTTATVTPQMLKNATATITELGLVPQTLEERITKELEEQLVAQQEPIKSIKKEESFMSKLKATAITTIDQNKEAAIIAAKMEAGRVINKQVIKQAAKHVPFWAKGYLDTPLAPVVLANAVAMLGNHTGNPKVQKVSELMLLAAADVTVQSFNLDKIIDDILSGIKLPAGILDEDEE